MKINRGSEWRKWDLHLHSPYTFLNKYTCSDDDFVNKIIGEELCCIGLTNYFKFDNKEFLLKQTLEKSNIVVFLNLELRLDYQNKDDDCLDLHVIFSNTITQEQVNKFLSNMTAHVGGTEKKLIDINDTNDFKRAVVNFDKLLICLNEESIGLKGNFLVGFLSRGKGNARTSTNYERVVKDADLLIHSTDNPNNIVEDRKFWLNYNKPLLQNSDAHSLETIGKKFTWIKAQPTFEGLKQIIHEPIERVQIQKEKPEIDKLDNLLIEKVSFLPSDDKFTPEPIYFSKNLNVIIGGKSSGKSILLFNIAKTLYENQNDSVLKYKDADDDFKEKDLYNLSLDDSNFDFTIDTYLGTNQSIKRENKQASILPSIKYIPQNHLSNLVDKSKRNSNELKKYIRNLILEEPKYNKIYEDFKDKLRQNDKIREDDISEYFTYKEELKKKNEGLQQKGDKENIKKTIEALEKKITETNKELTPEQTLEYNTIANENSELEKNKNSLSNDLEKLYNFTESSRNILVELKAKKDLLLDNIELFEVKKEFEIKLNFIDNAINENDKVKNLVTKDENDNFQIIDDNIISLKFKEINEKISELKVKLSPLTNLFENQKLVSGYQKSISEEKIKLSEIEQIEKEIENINKTSKNRKDKIFKDIRDNRKLYDNLLADLLPRIGEIKEEDTELKIEDKIYFNFPKYRESILGISHGNSKTYSNFKIYSEENKALINYDFENYISDLENVFDSIENNDYKLLKDISKQYAITKVLEQRFFFDHWDITYKSDTIHNMSTGKASLVLLKVMIKLSDVKGPILIDQPEDNLDNRSVTNELIEYLKEKKKERQIILVTHNANIVVNADAENIIIANQKGQSDDDKLGSSYLFDYISGALEDIEPISKDKDEKDLLKSMGIREHITQIVEGGKEAFKKREEKYGFKIL
ncbi:TrlF family AAA-like ATPase [Epilithonimonas sp. UC225_85]|uniref:TrlF family AAA-like ATPase n=1 Tax=Epilithonimonas sp. UC225_85 TaxID=3350167 RepID=UPI0036D22D57